MGLSDVVENVRAGFSSSSYVSGGKDFLESNSMVAKFAFLILALLLFMMLLSFGSFIMAAIFGPSHNPYLVDGMINSKQMIIIPQNPSKPAAVPILRSNNEREGLEFTWSVWIFVDDFSYKEHEYKHVFHKGNNNVNSAGMNHPINGPGLYIMPNTNALKVVMNTFDNIDESVVIDNLPLNKWVNVIIRVNKQHQMDVYINGSLTKRHDFINADGAFSVPRQNYGDVYVSMNGGFSGNTSDLRYFEEAIGTNQIQKIVNAGPNKTLVAGALSLDSDMNKYLSTRWYLSSATDS